MKNKRSAKKKKYLWLYNMYRGVFTKSNYLIFGYVMGLLISLLFMKYDVILGLYIFFLISFCLSIYYFIWEIIFYIVNNKK